MITYFLLKGIQGAFDGSGAKVRIILIYTF